MKIAYVSTSDPGDIHAWSGLVTHIYDTLQAAGFEMHAICKFSETHVIRSKIKKAFYSGILSKKYLRDREPKLLMHYARQLAGQLAETDCDIIFSPGYAPVAYLKTDKPIVFWADATFAGLLDFYPAFSNLCTESIRNGHEIEQRALSNCRLAIYSSDWAAQSAIKNYDVDPAKVKVLPFAANIRSDRNIETIESIISNKAKNVCHLLFLGVEWQRKGGDIALQVAERLNRRGINTVLHIAGCDPAISLPDFAVRHGFISKHSDAGRTILDTLFSEAHFLILPARAECFGIVFAEAGSFGLPSLASNVGGIPTAIHDGKNGQTFPVDADPEQYCDYIENLMRSPDAYRELSLAAFAEYSERLNWEKVGEQLGKLLREL